MFFTIYTFILQIFRTAGVETFLSEFIAISDVYWSKASTLSIKKWVHSRRSANLASAGSSARLSRRCWRFLLIYRWRLVSYPLVLLSMLSLARISHRAYLRLYPLVCPSLDQLTAIFLVVHLSVLRAVLGPYSNRFDRLPRYKGLSAPSSPNWPDHWTQAFWTPLLSPLLRHYPPMVNTAHWGQFHNCA